MNHFVEDLHELAFIIVEEKAFGGFLYIDHSGDQSVLQTVDRQVIAPMEMFYSVHSQILRHTGLSNPEQADTPTSVKMLMARFGGVVFAQLVNEVDEDRLLDLREAFDLSDYFSAYAEEVIEEVDELAAFRW